MTSDSGPPDATRAAARPLPWTMLLAAGLVLVLGWWFKAHCYLDGGWEAGEQYTTGCYTDVVPFWGERDVAAGAVPYLDTPLEYPVLTGAQIWLEGSASRAIAGGAGNALAFLALVTVANGALAIGILVLLLRSGVPRRRLWWWALAPPLILYVGHNWDLMAMFFVMLAIDQHRRGHDVASGVAVGLGTASKLFPGLLLPLLVLTHLRRHATGAAVRTIGAAALAWLAVNVPVALATPARWAEFYTFSQERLGTFAATWTVLDELGLLATSVGQRNLWGSLLFVVGAAVIVAAGWRVHAGHEWALLTPLVAWFLLTNKVYSPQFDLWLVPLLLLTVARLWPLAAFVLADALVYWTEFWYLARLSEFAPSAPYPALALTATMRVVVLLSIVVLAVRARPPAWLAAPTATDDDARPAAVGADRR